MRLLGEIPLVDEMRCTGCGDCVAVCPTQCLELSYLVPLLARPRDCVSCAICARACSVEAIRMMDPMRAKQGVGTEPTPFP